MMKLIAASRNSVNAPKMKPWDNNKNKLLKNKAKA
jgi:hypothetical protein